LKKYVSSGISPFTIKEAPRVREDEVIIAMLSARESPTTSSSIDELVGGRLLANLVAMEFKTGVVHQG
jgi:hypothetical protein